MSTLFRATRSAKDEPGVVRVVRTVPGDQERVRGRLESGGWLFRIPLLEIRASGLDSAFCVDKGDGIAGRGGARERRGRGNQRLGEVACGDDEVLALVGIGQNTTPGEGVEELADGRVAEDVLHRAGWGGGRCGGSVGLRTRVRWREGSGRGTKTWYLADLGDD